MRFAKHIRRIGVTIASTLALSYANVIFANDSAATLGARGGLAWQSRNIDLALKAESIFLDQVFDFNQLLLGHNVLPPVLVDSDNNLNLDDDDTLRIDTKTYRIIRPA